MKVLIVPSAEKAAARAAGILADSLMTRDKPVLGLATGGTMKRIYADLVARHRSGTLSFANATTFNLDEYVGLPPDHPQSYRQAMEHYLFAHVDINQAATHLPRGDAPDPNGEALRYERAIAAAGGIDVQMLGIGHNGHIGFNEPTSSLGGRTRIKTLTRSTRQANARFFDRLESVPRYAITMGIATVLDARHCLLVAMGTSKAAAIARMIEGPIGADCPATALQLHAQTTVIVDRDAAADLRMINYYQEIHPDGEEAVLD